MGSSYFLKCVLLCFIIAFLFLLSQYLNHDIVHYIVLRTSSITTSTKSMKTEFTINDTIHERLTKIQKRCGNLCNTNKPVQRGDFMGTVKAPIDCKNHFKLMDDISTAFSPIIPPKLDDLPNEIRSLYTYNNRLPTSTWYIDERSIGNERNEAKVFTLDMMEESFWGPIRNGSDVGWYPGCGKLLDEAADVINIEGKNVLVIGTQWPWAEAILLTKNPKKIVTLEYGQFVSEHPDWVFMRPNEFRQKYFDGTLDTFDAVFSYSSLEHSGLGAIEKLFHNALGLVDIFEIFPDQGHMKAFVYRSCCEKGFCLKINILEGKF